jgi:hypothetical protein
MKDRLYMAVQADTSYVKNPRELADIISRHYDEQAAIIKSSKSI